MAGAATVTVAAADFVTSAALIAVTIKVPAVAGAVYRPLDEMLPPLADQVTLVMLEPVTVAMNCCVPPSFKDADTGETETAITGALLTVTVADADWLVSAALVAVTV